MTQGPGPSLPGDTRAPAMLDDTTSEEAEGPMAVQEITYPSGAGRGRAAVVAADAGG
jgi:hypothetical protein